MTLTVGGRTHQLEIIGIAAEALAPNSLNAVISGGSIYLPRDPTASGPVSLLARSAGVASSVIEPLSQMLSGLAGRTRLRVRPLAETVGYDPRESLLVRGLLAMFSTLALTLAAGGIFAVSRHSVLQRTREFGIRLALGATRAGLVRMVIGRDMKLVSAAVAIAAGGTLAVTYFAFIELLRLAVSDPLLWIRIRGYQGACRPSRVGRLHVGSAAWSRWLPCVICKDPEPVRLIVARAGQPCQVQ